MIQVEESEVLNPMTLTHQDRYIQSKQRSRSWRSSFPRFSSWRHVTLLGVASATTVAICNIIFLIWSLTKHGRLYAHGIVTLADGSCDGIARQNTIAHLVISAFSSMLLWASNHCIQILCSPSRFDTDQAHKHGIWLSIGSSSFRNLMFIPAKRLVLCILLALSSFPLALFYNSVIFQKLSAVEYMVLPVTQDFLTDGIRIFDDNTTLAVDPQTSVPTVNVDSCCYQWANWNHLNGSEPHISSACTCLSNGKWGNGEFVQDNSTRTWRVRCPDQPGILLEPNNTGYYCAIETRPNAFDLYSGISKPQFDLKAFQSSQTQVLNKTDCLSTYSTDFLSNFGNLLLVTTDNHATTNIAGPPYSPILTLPGSSIPSNWMYSGMAGGLSRDQALRALRAGEQWSFMTSDLGYFYRDHFSNMFETWDYTQDNPYAEISLSKYTWNFTVDHCIAQNVPEHCELAMSPFLLMSVILCNLIKLVAFIWAVNSFDFKPLTTTGDAIDSFLASPDQTTSDQTTLSKADVTHDRWGSQTAGATSVSSRAQSWISRKKRWLTATGLLPFASFVIVSSVAYIIIVGGIIGADEDDSTDIDFLDFDDNEFTPSTFGKAQKYFLASNTDDLPSIGNSFANILLSNVPQLVISLFYVTYNTLFSEMTLADELTSYATKRKGLRVSKPRGYQRSSYFLSLPLRYSGPIAIATFLLHWLATEAIFFVYVAMVKPDGSLDPIHDVNTIGWSPGALVLLIALGGLMILSFSLWGIFRRYPANAVIISNCSAAISAACHSPAALDSDPAARKIKYGVFAGQDGLDVKKVGFSADEVDPLVPGELYEGCGPPVGFREQLRNMWHGWCLMWHVRFRESRWDDLPEMETLVEEEKDHRKGDEKDDVEVEVTNLPKVYAGKAGYLPIYQQFTSGRTSPQSEH